jgi:hypothetical protein
VRQQNFRAAATRMRHAGRVALITFGGGRQLAISIDQPQALQQGAGLHRLIFPVKLDGRNTLSGGVSVTLSGHVWLTMSGMEWLGIWTTERPAVSVEGLEFGTTVVLPLTDAQLAVIEQRRAGRDLRLIFDANAVLGYDPAAGSGDENARWPARSFQDSVQVYAEAWVRLLNQAAAAMSLAIVVPVPLNASAAARVGKHLRDAIGKVNDGQYGDAVITARKAIEAMDTSWPGERTIVQIAKEDRTLTQRFAMLRHSLHALASPSAHSDDIAESIHWDREKALAVIAGVSALAACKSP